MKNPVADTDTLAESDAGGSIVELDTTHKIEDGNQADNLDVTITVTKKTVKTGEEIELTASVKGVRGTSVVLNWLNITEHGELSSTNENPVKWTAPESIGEDATRVEVLQLVVTVISEVVSVGSKGIQTDTQIFSDTKEILIQVVDG
ncbi:hypothetical protein JT359_00125 [Candidatus Poribacteria bacterium]|nr:hypothetical protein [Candidatus Poribacteria bacterium]